MIQEKYVTLSAPYPYGLEDIMSNKNKQTLVRSVPWFLTFYIFIDKYILFQTKPLNSLFCAIETIRLSMLRYW